jgi:hypothetical protein
MIPVDTVSGVFDSAQSEINNGDWSILLNVYWVLGANIGLDGFP